MFQFIAANLATIIVCLVLLLIVGAVIFSMVRAKKQGKSSCGCNCSGCAAAGSCHSKQ